MATNQKKQTAANKKKESANPRTSAPKQNNPHGAAAPTEHPQNKNCPTSPSSQKTHW